MNYTEKHKFNLIETTDTFSPEPLNQNMETLEQALAALANRDDAGDAQAAALAKRVSTLEEHYFTTGTFKGRGDLTVSVGFPPKFVLLGCNSGTWLLIPGVTFVYTQAKAAEIRGNGFYIYDSSHPFTSGEHPYVAFA